MKPFKSVLIAILAGLACSQPMLVEAASRHHAHGAQKSQHAAPAGKKQALAKASGGKRSKASQSASNVPAQTNKSCKVRRVKQGRRYRSVRTCAEVAEPALKSPIQNTDLEKPVVSSGKENEIKARTVPDRAYAVDGETFFFQGRKYRVAGLTGVDGSEMAKQRLQKSLDAGSLTLEPVSADESGVSTAVVRINGRNLADLPKP